MTLPHTPSFRLDGRCALITGAGRGIGFALAAALSEAGARVVLAARSANEIEDAAERLRDDGRLAEGVALDVSDLDSVSRFFAARPAFDVLINNAGTNRPKPIDEVTEDDYDAVLGVNLKSAIFVSQAAVRGMKAEGVKGSLIHIGSQMGHVGGAGRTLYCASKWGLEGFNKALALDLAPFGIRSNVIAPTFIETPMTQPYLSDPTFQDAVISRIKLGRLGRVEDLMGAAVYLASDASALMTGSSVVVDGGWTAD